MNSFYYLKHPWLEGKTLTFVLGYPPRTLVYG